MTHKITPLTLNTPLNTSRALSLPLSLLLGVLSGALSACDDSSSEVGEGTLNLSIYGEPFIEEGISAEETADGWAVRFERFEVEVKELSVAGETLSSLPTRDLTTPTGGAGQPLASLTVPAGTYEGASVTLGVIDVKGEANLGEQRKRFEWRFEQEVRYGRCEVETTVSASQEASLELTIHADHLLYDSLAAEEPALRFEALAAADLNGDDLITQEELEATDIGGYDPGSDGAEINDLWAWLSALTANLAHANGEAHCLP